MPESTDPVTLHFRVQPEPSRLARARERIRDYLGEHNPDERFVDDVVLAVEEATNNAILHSGTDEPVEIRLAFQGDDLIAEVRDRGRGFDTSTFDPSTPPDPLQERGRGLYLVSQMTDHMRLTCDGGTTLRMVKTLARSPACHPLTSVSQTADAETGYRSLRRWSLLEEMGEGFVTLDWEYRITYANQAGLELLGLDPERAIGMNLWEGLPFVRESNVKRAVRHAMELGFSSIEEHESAGLGRWLEYRVYATSSGVTLYVRDIDQRKRKELERDRLAAELQIQNEKLQTQSEELQTQSEELATQTDELRTLTGTLSTRVELAEALNTINEVVHSSLGFAEVMERALSMGGEALGADTAAVSLHEPGRFIVSYVWRWPSARLGAIVSEEQDTHGVAALDSMQPVAIDDTSRDHRVVRQLMDEWGIRSVIAVPLIFRSEGIGVLYYNYTTRVHRFSPEEVDFARKLGSTVSLALENARLYEAQQMIARTLQENMMHPLPEIRGLELASLSLTANQPELIGGDFHDVFRRPDGLVVALIGDVMGKGILAAGLTETMRSATRALALASPMPEYILRQLNLLIRAEHHEQFVSAQVAMLDPENGRGFVSSGGHPPPIHLSGVRAVSLEKARGPLLGVLDGSFSAAEFMLAPGDTLVFYTDGVTEARQNGKLFGESRLRSVLAAAGRCDPQSVVEIVRDEVLGFAGELKDDLQVLVLRRSEDDGGRDEGPWD